MPFARPERPAWSEPSLQARNSTSASAAPTRPDVSPRAAWRARHAFVRVSDTSGNPAKPQSWRELQPALWTVRHGLVRVSDTGRGRSAQSLRRGTSAARADVFLVDAPLRPSCCRRRLRACAGGARRRPAGARCGCRLERGDGARRRRPVRDRESEWSDPGGTHSAQRRASARPEPRVPGPSRFPQLRTTHRRADYRRTAGRSS